MKKILFLLLISGALLASSCTKNYAVVPNQTSYATLASTDWSTTDNGLNYTASITPAKGNFGLSSDGILIYFTFDGGKSYEQIPEVYNNVSYTYTNDGGTITLYAQSANGAQTISVPPALGTKIVVVPSN
ncbi:hypothetical protein SAMN05216490_3772 [Mucilaginibacter mallensis]|uniref:Uncharacterized protein n=1 Tax=Mucilaginibacter mallensis TaxID=652787 RepID=A0A1H2AX45_MUCMA|nr:hypothetical protein [Mucilaginibacter mallensis]SDT50392.1 hypothetical protein SAMN05216490_3772 [Mucilaginibacter mallensis]